jgi:D-alanyl-lipoteichoic acid acyltransferase DltB (MBOAT superfamily)
LALFGLSAFKIFTIISVHYIVIEFIDSKPSGPIFSWIFGITILFLNNYYDGYRYAAISSSLKWMDLLNGIGLRWHITFNFTILRMISYSMDKYWSKNNTDYILTKSHIFRCDECNSNSSPCEKGRIEKSLANGYNFVNYTTYLLYAPLFMAGPIISFNNFISQVNLKIISCEKVQSRLLSIHLSSTH